MIDERLIELPELRIGNLLDYKGEIVKVTMLSCDIDDEYEDQICFVKLGTSANEKGGWNRSLVNDLKRIPLTPEWLQILGFVKAEEAPGDGWYEIKIVRHVLQVCFNGNCNMINIVDEHGTSVLFCKVLLMQYVHQLQNLYFAFNCEEVTIKETA
jgi:hypothetical protein